MKDEIRVLGVDDAPFDSDGMNEDVLVVGTVFRGGSVLDDVVSTTVEQDGDDATLQLVEMINGCKFNPQLQAVFLDGIAFAGFNVVNLRVVQEQTGIPVVTVSRDEPDRESMTGALRKLDMPEKARLVENAPEPVQVRDLFIQMVGDIDVEELLDICCVHSNVPEALRTAHLIAGGIADGESRGGA